MQTSVISTWRYNRGRVGQGVHLMKANRKCSVSKNNHAQVGIGTLIIFIAFVLLAAVAAMVLIEVAAMLQQKAQTTGKEATKEVSSNIDVDSIEGWRGGTQVSASMADVFSEEFYRLDIIYSLKVGSEPVDMNQVVITITDGTTTSDLAYIEGTLVTETANVGAGGDGLKADGAAIGCTNTTFRILVDGDPATHTNSVAGHDAAIVIFRRAYSDANAQDDKVHDPSAGGDSHEIIAMDAGMFDSATYGGQSNTTQDEYFARGDMFFIIEEIRDEDKSFTKDNPVMNTGDLVKAIILTAPANVAEEPWAPTACPDLYNNNPCVGEADLDLKPRTTVSIVIIPESGATTMVDFVTPSSYGITTNTNLYP